MKCGLNWAGNLMMRSNNKRIRVVVWMGCLVTAFVLVVALANDCIRDAFICWGKAGYAKTSFSVEDVGVLRWYKCGQWKYVEGHVSSQAEPVRLSCADFRESELCRGRVATVWVRREKLNFSVGGGPVDLVGDYHYGLVTLWRVFLLSTGCVLGLVGCVFFIRKIQIEFG